MKLAPQKSKTENPLPLIDATIEAHVEALGKARTRIRELTVEAVELEDRRDEALARGDRKAYREANDQLAANAEEIAFAEKAIENLPDEIKQLRADRQAATLAEMKAKWAALEDPTRLIAALAENYARRVEITRAVMAAGLPLEAAQFQTPPPIIFDLSKVNGANASIQVNPAIYVWADQNDRKISAWKEEVANV
jgi:chromosome segregation ATPase